MARKPDTPWYDRARTAGQLSVFAGPTLKKLAWARILPKAITEFNTLANQLNFGVTLVASSDAPEEDDNSFGGADIRFEAGDQIQVKMSGQDVNIKLGPLEGGHTETLAWDFGKGAQIRKACILMKPKPMADPFHRLVGDGVLTTTAVHEFVHALGLHEHTLNGGDLMQDIPQFRAGAKDKPNDDKLEVNGGKQLPPNFLLPATITRVQTLWPKP